MHVSSNFGSKSQNVNSYLFFFVKKITLLHSLDIEKHVYRFQAAQLYINTCKINTSPSFCHCNTGMNTLCSIRLLLHPAGCDTR